MIVSTFLGLLMNVMMVDNATGQNLTRAIFLGKRIEKLKQEDDKEEKEITKQTIIGLHNDN